jgi:hypothetical protein
VFGRTEELAVVEIAWEMIVSHGKKWYKNGLKPNCKIFILVESRNLQTFKANVLKRKSVWKNKACLTRAYLLKIQ